MQQLRISKQVAFLAAAFAMLIASLVVPHAQQPGSGAPPPKPLVPLAASTLANNPEPYYGASVTLSAAVEQTLSKSAFSVDQDKTKSTGKEVLILAPTLLSPVELNTYVTVIGEVMHFDPAEIAKKAKDYKLDLAPDVAAKYSGRPVIVATAVINSAGVDIAKRPPPPMTADDLALSKVMKQVGPANAALRRAADEMDVNLAKEHAAVLKAAFVQTEAFWKAKGKTDATQWAADARKHVESYESATVSGKWDEAKGSAGALGQMCQSCHAAYRERMDDGTFRIKTGTK